MQLSFFVEILSFTIYLQSNLQEIYSLVCYIWPEYPDNEICMTYQKNYKILLCIMTASLVRNNWDSSNKKDKY